MVEDGEVEFEVAPGDRILLLLLFELVYLLDVLVDDADLASITGRFLAPCIRTLIVEGMIGC